MRMEQSHNHDEQKKIYYSHYNNWNDLNQHHSRWDCNTSLSFIFIFYLKKKNIKKLETRNSTTPQTTIFVWVNISRRVFLEDIRKFSKLKKYTIKVTTMICINRK